MVVGYGDGSLSFRRCVVSMLPGSACHISSTCINLGCQISVHFHRSPRCVRNLFTRFILPGRSNWQPSFEFEVSRQLRSALKDVYQRRLAKLETRTERESRTGSQPVSNEPYLFLSFPLIQGMKPPPFLEQVCHRQRTKSSTPKQESLIYHLAPERLSPQTHPPFPRPNSHTVADRLQSYTSPLT